MLIINKKMNLIKSISFFNNLIYSVEFKKWYSRVNLGKSIL